MHNTDDPDVEPVVDTLVDLHRDVGRRTGNDLGHVFRHWVRLSVYALAGDDAAYHGVLDRYDDGDDGRATAARAFADALGEVTIATLDANRPVIGTVYEQVGHKSDALGQHFTPYSVAYAKAAMLTPDDAAEVDGTADDPVTAADPACGSGRLLVCFAQALHEVDPTASVAVQGTDLDRTCAEMAVVNCALADIPARIYHGNSLTRETHREYVVTPSPFRQTVSIDEHSDDRLPPAEADRDDDGDGRGGESEDAGEAGTDAESTADVTPAGVQVRLGDLG